MPGVNPSCFQSSLVLRNMAGLIPALHHLSNNFINCPYSPKNSTKHSRVYSTKFYLLVMVLIYNSELGDKTKTLYMATVCYGPMDVSEELNYFTLKSKY